MTQPISSYRPDRSQTTPDSGGPTQPAPRVAVPQPSLPELPDIDAALVANAVKAATAGAPQSPHPLLAMGVKGVDVEFTVPTPLQTNLDAFMKSAMPTFHTKDGDVQVPIPFRMVPKDEASFLAQRDDAAQPFIQQERTALANGGELAKIAASVGLGGRALADVASGRGTPESIRRVTQALIDAGKLPPGPPPTVGARIRIMMCNYGVGLDCAGYVQQAFLASRGVSRDGSGLRPAPREDLSALTTRGFKSVPSLSQARAGDLFILSPPADQNTGHTTIIRDVRMADAQEAKELPGYSRDWEQQNPSMIQRFELDSSWGNGANPQSGGVMRQTFWHDTVNDKWMHPVGKSWIVETHTPYFAHPLDGVYRPSTEP